MGLDDDDGIDGQCICASHPYVIASGASVRSGEALFSPTKWALFVRMRVLCVLCICGRLLYKYWKIDVFLYVCWVGFMRPRN